MLGWLKSDPVKKLKAEHAKLLERGVEAQRNGKIELYGQLMTEAEELWKKIDALEAAAKKE